jgi:hypothetical protein
MEKKELLFLTLLKMSACVFVEKPSRGGYPVVSHGQLFRSVNHTNPGSSLRGITDGPPYLPADPTLTSLPPLSHLEHLCWDVAVDHKNSLLLFIELFAFDSFWGGGRVWDCREHMSNLLWRSHEYLSASQTGLLVKGGIFMFLSVG